MRGNIGEPLDLSQGVDSLIDTEILALDGVHEVQDETTMFPVVSPFFAHPSQQIMHLISRKHGRCTGVIKAPTI